MSLEKLKAELKSMVDTGNDRILKAGFAHPCKNSCSGWQSGYERSQFESAHIASQLLSAIELAVAVDRWRDAWASQDTSDAEPARKEMLDKLDAFLAKLTKEAE